MATAAESPAPLAEALAPEQRFLLRDIDWTTYRAVADALGARHLRLSFDGRSLELMTISRLHGRLSRLLGRLVMTLSEEFGLPISSCGDFTIDRGDLERGLEPDECFYLQNEPLVREKEELDLTTDPPPDLAVEIDVSRDSRRRLRIYAEIGVPEVWRFDGAALECYQRDAAGKYVRGDVSRCFPGLRPTSLLAFLGHYNQMDENSIIQDFRAWVREQTAGGWSAAS